MVEYTSQECTNEINNEYKNYFGYYMIDKPSINSINELKEEFRFWWNLRDKLNNNIDLETQNIIHTKKAMSLNMRKTMTKFHIIDSIEEKLRQSANLTFDEYIELISSKTNDDKKRETIYEIITDDNNEGKYHTIMEMVCEKQVSLDIKKDKTIIVAKLWLDSYKNKDSKLISKITYNNPIEIINLFYSGVKIMKDNKDSSIDTMETHNFINEASYLYSYNVMLFSYKWCERLDTKYNFKI